MASAVPNVTLNSGVEMPQLGFGVFQVPNSDTQAAVEEALAVGYRSIDTAAVYGNEEGVGRALAASGLSRDDVFITTKLWISDLGRTSTRSALEESLTKLGLGSVDLYLIHWPAPGTDKYLESWQEMEELKRDKLAHSIGVSNFQPEHLDRIADLGGTVPAVNQIELHPYLQNVETVAANERLGIKTEAWSPLAQGAVLGEDVIVELARKYDVGPAKIVLRWHLQKGNIVIPKSVTPARIASNFDVFGFELTAADISAIDALERDGRTGPDPDSFNG